MICSGNYNVLSIGYMHNNKNTLCTLDNNCTIINSHHCHVLLTFSDVFFLQHLNSN